MSAFIQQSSLVSGRQMTMAVTVGLHALVISVLMAIRIAPEAIPAIPRIHFLTPESPPQEEYIPARISEMQMVTPPRIEVIAPNVEIQLPPEERAAAGPSTPISPDVPTDSPAGDGANIRMPLQTELGYRVVRSPDEFYPPTSLQLQEEGVTVVRVCVGASGRMEGRPVVETTSGSRRLDAAAIDWAREALRFSPATRDGVPISACKGFKVNFNLR